jgi:thymidylate kinase
MRDVAHLVDDAASGRVLVLGSLPPAGRDLDVLAWPEDREAIVARLTAEGFRRRNGHLVRFADGSAYAVELAPAESYGVPEPELREAFAAGIPLDGMERLVRPAPHHSLLILARLGMTRKRLPRLERALAEDPEALAKAERIAPVWRADLRRLRPRSVHRPRRPRRTVIALSGLDGAGKSSQAAAAVAALERLGHRADAVWMPITANAGVWLVSALARAVLGQLPAARRKVEAGGSFLAAPGASRRPGALTRLWVTYIALLNALTHRRLAARGRVTVFDRYALDSVVRMRYLWGTRSLLVERLSPRPALAFLLDVPAEVAHARKPEQWSPAELARFRELYLEEAERLGVVVLDGTLPADELSARIAEEAWNRLG